MAPNKKKYSQEKAKFPAGFQSTVERSWQSFDVKCFFVLEKIPADRGRSLILWFCFGLCEMASSKIYGIRLLKCLSHYA